MTKLQIEIFKKMSPAKKWQLTMDLYYSMRALKKAAIRQQNPNWDDKKVENELIKHFIHART